MTWNSSCGVHTDPFHLINCLNVVNLFHYYGYYCISQSVPSYIRSIPSCDLKPPGNQNRYIQEVRGSRDWSHLLSLENALIALILYLKPIYIFFSFSSPSPSYKLGNGVYPLFLIRLNSGEISSKTNTWPISNTEC